MSSAYEKQLRIEHIGQQLLQACILEQDEEHAEKRAVHTRRKHELINEGRRLLAELGLHHHTEPEQGQNVYPEAKHD